MESWPHSHGSCKYSLISLLAAKPRAPLSRRRGSAFANSSDDARHGFGASQPWFPAEAGECVESARAVPGGRGANLGRLVYYHGYGSHNISAIYGKWTVVRSGRARELIRDRQ